MYDFANILFAGRCNARCYFCIGRPASGEARIRSELQPPNLDVYPPRGLEAFIARVRQDDIRQIVLTGSNTDPQLYAHEARLLEALRQALPEAQVSLHTNGRQALHKMEVLNLYDRVSLSFPSFDPHTYRQMMGVPNPPDLDAILRRARPPVKLSCVLTEHNLPEIPAFLLRCADLGIRRVVLRKLYGDHRPWESLLPVSAWQSAGSYRANPVYKVHGMEVTLWDFERTASTSLNLFANGQVSPEYLLSPTIGQHPTPRRAPPPPALLPPAHRNTPLPPQ